MDKLRAKRIVVAMSGGVDSSLTAALLKENGCDVIGITLKLFDYKRECGQTRKKTCCSTEDVYDARRVCEKIDIPFYVLDYKGVFKECVIDNFIDEYLKGRTPNPCIICNEKIKFHYLLKQADELGAEYIATGHYAQKETDPETGLQKLMRGRDESKDQSYFLFNLNQEQLKKIIFPLGDFTKEHVRKLAGKYGLKVAEKPDSQEICFVTDNNYQNFINENADKKRLTPGNIVDASGRKYGRHKGIYRYTIGQRKGLGIANPYPLYVLGFDIEKNEVIVGRDDQLFKSEIALNNVSFISGVPPNEDLSCQAKIRYTQKPSDAVLSMTGETAGTLSFLTPQRAVTPGQAAVLYSGNEVIGGGWIEK